MEKVKITFFCIYASVSLAALLLISSCSTFKEIVKETVIESITDPKTGTPIFTREYDTEPYQINIGEIIRSRKKQKLKRKREIIENYEIEQADSGQKVMVDSIGRYKFTRSFHKSTP